MQNSVKKSFNNKYVLDFTTYQRFLDYLKTYQAIKDIFRNILLFGKYKEKDLVISQVKDCYDKNLYNDKDIHCITKDISKEKNRFVFRRKEL